MNFLVCFVLWFVVLDHGLEASDVNVEKDSGNQTQKSEQLVELDVKNKQSTTEYTYTKDDTKKTETYEAKDNYAFKKVKNGDTVLLEPKGSPNYVKVTLDCSDSKKVSVSLEYSSKSIDDDLSQNEEESSGVSAAGTGSLRTRGGVTETEGYSLTSSVLQSSYDKTDDTESKSVETIVESLVKAQSEEEERKKKLFDDLKKKLESGLDGKITDQAKLDAAMLKPALEAAKDVELRALVEKVFDVASPQLIRVDLVSVSAEAGSDAGSSSSTNNKLVVTIVKLPDKLYDATSKVKETELELELKLDEELGVGATDPERKQKAQDLVAKFSKAAAESVNNARYSLLVKALQAKLEASLKENEEANNNNAMAQELETLKDEHTKYLDKVVNPTASTGAASSDSTEYKSLVVALAKQLEAKLKTEDDNLNANELLNSLKKVDTSKLKESLEKDEVKAKVLAMLDKELGYSQDLGTSTATGASAAAANEDESDTDVAVTITTSPPPGKPAPAKRKGSGKVEFMTVAAATSSASAQGSATAASSNKNKVTLFVTKPRGKQHEGTAKLSKSDAKGIKEDVEVEVKLDEELVKVDGDNLEDVCKAKATGIAQRVVKASEQATVSANRKRLVAALATHVVKLDDKVNTAGMQKFIKELEDLEDAKKADPLELTNNQTVESKQKDVAVASRYNQTKSGKSVDGGSQASNADSEKSEILSPLSSTEDNPYDLTFFYNSDRKVIKVMHNSQIIWEHFDKGPYPENTSFSSDILLFTIYFSKTLIYFYKFDGYGWYRLKLLENITDVCLDRKSTDRYCHSSQGYFDTYMPKDKYLITNVYKSRGSSCSRSVIDLWQAQVPSEYATKVVVNRYNWHDPKVDVTVFMLKGTQVTFTKPGYRKQFGKTSWSETTTQLPKDFYITTADDAQGTNPKSNDNSKFGVYKFICKDSSESSNRGIYKYVIEFYKKSKCIKIEYYGKTVWTNKANLNLFPVKLTIDLRSCIYYIEFEDLANNTKVHDSILENMARV